jgi:hypothetical protein
MNSASGLEYFVAQMHSLSPLMTPVAACRTSFQILLASSTLKVPKREIFDRSDFPDFYTMKSLRVGDFGVKIKKYFKNI